ncbi:MAG: hypothetical protein KC505_00320 [Myxococcales bacterium]|nr:hypothetical protein [Myxococcales bacterium]USN51156.1 MAG: hypothetical protein H6731_01730 [Myxococcales bacterium]
MARFARQIITTKKAWVDYELMSTIPGLFVLEEANFSDHGANRLGASALMQGLADGYFVLPYTICRYLNEVRPVKDDPQGPKARETQQATEARIAQLFSIKGTHSPDSFHRRLGKIIWDYCGMGRNEAGLKKALRVADFLEFAEVMCHDALTRKESCGGHFREEYQTPDGEVLRNDQDFCHVAAWAYKGDGQQPELYKEPLNFTSIELQQRSYK